MQQAVADYEIVNGPPVALSRSAGAVWAIRGDDLSLEEEAVVLLELVWQHLKVTAYDIGLANELELLGHMFNNVNIG